ncbi:hypothetical protein AGMMS49942_29680 [Spirochaetia bacterium]|nr:hypothetical protein AGMMS49942_29680 [Spirochaetia bacterium]
MKNTKKLFGWMLALALIFGFVLLGCESPEAADGLPGAPGATGDRGPQGNGGGPGTEGYTPAATFAIAKEFFDNGISKVYLSTSEASTDGLIIGSGKTLLVPGTADLGGVSGLVKVEKGGTLLITGAATVGGGSLEVSGTLTVYDKATLHIPTGETLTVNPGSTVTIRNGATLSTIDSIADADTDGAIIAKTIGKLVKTTATTLSKDAGTVTLQGNAWLGVPVADIAVGQPGWEAHNQLTNIAAITGGAAFPSTGTGYKLKIGVASINMVTPLTVPVGDELVIASVSGVGAADITVNGVMNIAPGGSFTSVDANKFIIVGGLTAGDLVITGAGAGVSAATKPVVVANSGAGRGSITFDHSSVLTIPTGANIVVGGPDGISLAAGTYGSDGSGQKSAITGIAGGGALLSQTANTVTFLVGVGTGDTGFLTVGSKSTVNLYGGAGALFTGNNSTNGAVVEFAIGSKLGVAGVYGKGLTKANGQAGTADGSSILPDAADVDTAGTGKFINSVFKVKSSGSGASWVTF